MWLMDISPALLTNFATSEISSPSSTSSIDQEFVPRRSNPTTDDAEAQDDWTKEDRLKSVVLDFVSVNVQTADAQYKRLMRSESQCAE